MLQFERVAKSFSGKTVFRGAGYRLDKGVFALQGPNGIGKSTLLAILSGALPADDGEIWIDGINLAKNPLAARRYLSYAPDESPIYPFMTGRELLEFVAKAKKAPLDTAVMQIVDGLGLSAHLHTRFSAMSLGTQKKSLLAAAWIGNPRVLLLDEPSNGLDVAARAYLAEMLRGRSKHSAILFSTHDTDFVKAAEAQVITMAHILS